MIVRKACAAGSLGLLLACWAAAAWAQTPLERDVQALENLRKGLDTPLETVDKLGADLLAKYDQPADQAQIQYELAHVHAQSGVREPEKILLYAQAALDSKLISARQRMTLYSYLCSAHEVNVAVKDFPARRRKAIEPLLLGLKELAALNLPAVAPELPGVGAFDIVGDPVAEARARAIHEAQMAARKQAELTRDLVQHRETLQKQVMYLYYREPVADDELRELATKAVGQKQAQELVAAAQAERERIEKARRERQAKLKTP